MHVRNILPKLGAANRVEAANTAHRLGLPRYGSPAVAGCSTGGVASAHVLAPARAGLPPHPPGRAGVRRRRRAGRGRRRPARGSRRASQRELDHRLREGVADAGIPGASAAIVFPDGRVWRGAAGDAVVKPRRAMTPDTSLPFDSITKLAAAALAMRLVEEGKLRLEDPVVRWYPALAGRRARDGPRPARPHLRRARPAGRDRPGPAAVAEDALARAPKPGPRTTDAEYSNVGYVIAGHVLERAAREPLAAALRRARVRPSRRDGPRLPARGAPAAAARALLLVSGRRRHPGRRERRRPVLPYRSLRRHVRRGRRPGRGRPLARALGARAVRGRVLGPASLREMARFRPGAFWEAYGLGLARDSFEDRTMWGHGGDGLGSHTELWHLPRERLTLAVTWNDDLLDREGGLHTVLLRAALGRLARLRARPACLELLLDLRDLRAALRRLRVASWPG